MKIKIIHNEWEDFIILDFSNNILYRTNIQNEYGTFILSDDKLYVKWDNWGSEIFIKKNDIYVILNEIPNIIHFVYGFKEQTEEFELYRYIAIKSAHDVNKPEKIYFHYYYEPYGQWWDKIKPILTLEKVDIPTEIYGNKLWHYAHQSDVIRLQKLIKYGGIYLDIDTICLKSFKDLLHHQFVMGYQAESNNTNIYGLCNAVILSCPNSTFALKWLDSYKEFRSKGRDQYWDEHSVIKPLMLSKMYESEIHIISNTAFFYPLWYDIADILFNNNINILYYKNIVKNNYCIHLWDTFSHNYLKTLTENDIFNVNTLYNIFSRKFLRNDISILILTYNRLEKTKSCLESYLKCLDIDYIKELVILDNNSDSDLITYLKEFQEQNNKSNKIKLIFSSENLGVCGGRTILFKEAIGDILISVDSDAYLVSNNFFSKIRSELYDEKYGIIGVSGAFIKSWAFNSQEDINDADENEYIVDHIAGCCQAFRRDLFNFDFGLDPYYGKFWVEDTDLSMQSLDLNKINMRFPQKNYLEHQWGGSGAKFEGLFQHNWNYFVNKWKDKVKLINKIS